jgi:hypothetical protein
MFFSLFSDEKIGLQMAKPLFTVETCELVSLKMFHRRVRGIAKQILFNFYKLKGPFTRGKISTDICAENSASKTLLSNT